MVNVVDIGKALWAKRTAQAEAEISAIQARVTSALHDGDDPVMAVYALFAAALCLTKPQDQTPEEWRAIVDDAFRECRRIIPVERENDGH